MLTTRPAHVLTLLVFLGACQDVSSPTNPDLAPAATRGASGLLANVKMMDACDPETFAGVPGGCLRNGGVTMEQFIAQLTNTGRAPGWRFAPADLFLREGDQYNATNVGGEVHTFTQVAAFGGGLVPPLNDLSGFTTVAPECGTLTGADFIPPGGSTPADDADQVGEEHYQCCIHPWMQTTVHVRGN